MARNLVVCCDGTANEFARDNTNVVKLYSVLRHEPERQVTYYHPGLGTMETAGALTTFTRRLTKLLGMAFGYGLAARVNLIVMPLWGWRGVFFVGVLPALFTVWIQRRVEEPEIWRAAAGGDRGRLAAIFAPSVAGTTIAVTLMNACCLFGWWGLNAWVPGYLQLPPASGGVGLSSSAMSLFVIAMQVGMWLGYVSFGFVADAIGRKRAYVAFLLVAAALLPLYGALRAPAALLVLGPLVAFFGTGYYSGLGAIVAEIYPTAVRATAAGFTYNFGRLASAAAPFTVAKIAVSGGFGAAFSVAGGAFLLAAGAWLWIPDTRNRELT